MPIYLTPSPTEFAEGGAVLRVSNLVDEFSLGDDYWDQARAAIHAHEIEQLLADGTGAVCLYWLLVSSTGRLRWKTLARASGMTPAEALRIARDLLRRARL